MFQVTDIDIYSPLNLIRKAPQILIDKNTTYPIEYHLFFAIFGQNQLLNQYCVWKLSKPQHYPKNTVFYSVNHSVIG